MTWNFFGLLGGDNGITQTVNVIRQAVDYGLHQPQLRQRAETIVATCPEKDDLCEISSILQWSRAHFRYTHDPRGIEFVKSPEISDAEISKQGFFIGDCDDIVTYMGCLLKSVGYAVRAAVIAIPNQGSDYRHIYLKVYSESQRRWIALEGTANKPVGWEAKNTRIREYDL